MKIAAIDQRATDMGLAAGMTLAAARARVPNLRVAEADDDADHAFLRRLAMMCEMFTPLVALEPPKGLTLDITGCAHLFGGEQGIFDRLRRRLARLGVIARASLAGTPDATRALARFGMAEIVPPGEEEREARALPVVALQMGDETTVALSRAGLKTIGDLADRPSVMLSARFGMALKDRLHRVLGHEDIRITPLRPPPDCIAERHFPEPVETVDSLLAALKSLSLEIGGLLERSGRGGRLYEAGFFRSDGVVRRLHIETAQASHDHASLLRLLRLKIEALVDPLEAGFGFDAVRLSVLRSDRFDQLQKSLDGREDDQSEIADLVGRLTARFGQHRVLRFIAADSHDPMRAAMMLPATFDAVSLPWPVLENGNPPSRPLTLFDPPQPVEAVAEVPDGAPLRFRWRRVLHEVTSAEGPERIAPEWWRETPAKATRDYYRVEDTNGRRFWLFRQGLYDRDAESPAWFLHGLFA